MEARDKATPTSRRNTTRTNPCRHLQGIDTAVVVSIDEWQKLKDENRLTWKDVLLGEGPRFEIPLPKRGTVKSRKPAVFD